MGARIVSLDSSGLRGVAGSVLPGRPNRLPHRVACAAGKAHAAMLDLTVLQIGQTNDQAKGKERRAPNQGGFNRIPAPFHALATIGAQRKPQNRGLTNRIQLTTMQPA